MQAAVQEVEAPPPRPSSRRVPWEDKGYTQGSSLGSESELDLTCEVSVRGRSPFRKLLTERTGS